MRVSRDAASPSPPTPRSCESLGCRQAVTCRGSQSKGSHFSRQSVSKPVNQDRGREGRHLHSFISLIEESASFASLSLSLSLSLYIYPSISLSIYLSIYLSISIYLYLYIYKYTHILHYYYLYIYIHIFIFMYIYIYT
jgi:hypothetical protein